MEDQKTLEPNPYKSRAGLKRLLPATAYSLNGIRAAWKHEAAFRQEVMLGAVLALSSIWLAPSLTLWILMNISLLLVLCMEIVNSAIEALADAITTDHHPLLGRAKDLGSAAVMLSLLIATGVWLAALYMRFMDTMPIPT